MNPAVLSLSLAAGLLISGLVPASAVPNAKPKSNGEIVDFDGELAMGTIIIRTGEKRLYYVLGDGQAVRYPVAVGEPRFQWAGELWVSSKQHNPIMAANRPDAARKPGAAPVGRPGTPQSTGSARDLSRVGGVPYPRDKRPAYHRFRCL